MSQPGEGPGRDEIEYGLKGKTFQLYVYLLRHGSAVGIREVQRELGFSSPSVASHHMDKLVGLGIVERDNFGRYVLIRKVDVGVLQSFANVGGMTLPRLGFYAPFFTVIAAASLLLTPASINLYTFVGTVGGAAAFWYEAWRTWRRRPF